MKRLDRFPYGMTARQVVRVYSFLFGQVALKVAFMVLTLLAWPLDAARRFIGRRIYGDIL